MGRDAAASHAQRPAAGDPALAKKALSIRPPTSAEADAKPRRPGRLHGHASGPSRSATEGSIDWLATLLEGRPRQRADVRWRARRGAAHELWLVIVDASASTRRHNALSEAKGVLAHLFDTAYRQRARLALLTASGQRPGWQAHGLKAGAALQPWLDGLGAGGGTPLLAALDEARSWLARRQRQRPAEQQRCLVLTDGRIKHLSPVSPLGCPTVLIDMEKGAIRLGRAVGLAGSLGADYQRLEDLRRC